MKTIILTTFLFLMGTTLSAQEENQQKTPPCSEKEFHQFDFWLGEWDLNWGEGETAGTGTNIVTRELGGCVIEENFSSNDETPFIGRSFSVYRPATGKWYQTWVDNNGGYLDFTGGFADGEMTLSREAERDGKKFLQRMVFYNITENAFDWNWEKSDDRGKTWELLWKIHYKRKS